MNPEQIVPCPACAPPKGDGNGTIYKIHKDVYIGNVKYEAWCSACWGRGELQARLIPSKYRKRVK